MPFIIDDIAIAAAMAAAAESAAAATAATAAAGTAGAAGAAGAGAAAAGAGATAAGGLAGLGGAGASAAGALEGGMLASGAMGGTGAAAADSALLAATGGAETGGLLAGAAPEVGAMSYVTPSVTGMEGAGAQAGVAEGMLPGAYSDVAGEQFLASQAQTSPWQTALGRVNKAGKAYSAGNAAMGGQQEQTPPPQARPVFQGESAPITQEQPQRNEHAFARQLLEQRRRGMLG